jgi:hypothetical protein
MSIHIIINSNEFGLVLLIMKINCTMLKLYCDVILCDGNAWPAITERGFNGNK